MLSGVLGIVMVFIFTKKLIPREDFIAHTVLQEKAMIRNQAKMEESLVIIRNGHIAIGLILMVLIVLQLSVLFCEDGQKGNEGEGEEVVVKKGVSQGTKAKTISPTRGSKRVSSNLKQQ